MVEQDRRNAQTPPLTLTDAEHLIADVWLRFWRGYQTHEDKEVRLQDINNILARTNSGELGELEERLGKIRDATEFQVKQERVTARTIHDLGRRKTRR